MKQNKIDRFLCFLWFLVPVFSLLRLRRPIMEINMEPGSTCVAMPVKSYNGLQLLIRRYLVNGYNTIVTDMGNPGFNILKMMIVLQLICDVILVSTCLREWRGEQSSKAFLRLRGVLSMGYVLTAFAIYHFVSVCGDHLQLNRYHSFSGTPNARYCYDELEKNILFSIGVVVLWIISGLFIKTRSAYRTISYLWFFVPLLSLFILMQPVMEIEVDAIGQEIEGVLYNGFQLLFGGDLVNAQGDLVIDGNNPEYNLMKIMIALQLIFNISIVFMGIWEWRKKRNPMIFLGLRGILTVGYVLTAHAIYQLVEEWSKQIEIDHDPSPSFSSRTSYISQYWGVELNTSLSIGIVILFVLTLLSFLYQKKRKRKTVSWLP